ncbi:TetR/AcrR family transcriptional regulator [Asticcacaulis sp. 201]|uniref:TetR/AcrR family transcriptional regulator n=1 Tax=Asticcacaulis sp. 201 TaxID=3028787 RepID=UPI0029167653|nr:TetR/AcrR family transcriptional regulator [Asticcacaulis sp. 201]MDV6330439.1 TetR/AcrR family transcriptional regulator [Asticcacaulis sp. 201]
MQTQNVTALKPHEPKGRMSSEERREAILDVATEIFMEEGYASASMSTIAARLGGSKGTLYNYFKSKEELFTAYVQRHCVFHRGQTTALLNEEGEARKVLKNYATRYLRSFTSEQTLQNWRIISAESQKSPEIGRLFYESGPLSGVRILAGYFDKAQARGELNFPNAEQVAHQFVSLIHGRMIKARLMNYIPEPTDAEIAAEVDAALFVFFAAYGVSKPTDPVSLS